MTNHDKQRAGLPANLVAAVSLALLLASCSSPQEKAAEFVAQAQKLYAAGDYDGAALEARNAAQIEPKNAEARYLIALVFEQKAEVREAIGSLLIAVDANPQHEKAQLKLGTLFFFVGAYAEAEKHAGIAAGLAPGNPEVLLLQARLLLQKKDYAGGLTTLDSVIASDPGNLDALVLKAILLTQSDPQAALAFIDTTIKNMDAQQARGLRRMRIPLLADLQPALVESELKSLMSDFPEDDEYPVQLAGHYAQSGRVDDAEKTIRTLAERRPKDVNVRLGLVQFLAERRGAEAAEAALKEFAAELPDRPELGMALARRYEQTKRPDLAVATYQDIAKREPKTPAGLSARNKVAQIAFVRGNADEGRKLIDAILADVPEEPEALLVRAGLRIDEGKYDDAIADLRTILRSKETAEPALLLLAQAYVRTNNPTLAADTYRRLLAVNPLQATAATSLAAILADQNDLPGAVQTLGDYLRNAPNDMVTLAALTGFQLRQGDDKAAEITARRIMAIEGQPGIGEFQLGRVYQLRQQYPEALQAFRASRKLRPDDPLPLEGLADVLVASGKTDLAIQELRSYLKTRPDQPQARYVLAGILAGQGDKAGARAAYEQLLKGQPDVAVHYIGLARLEESPASRVVILERGLKAAPRDNGLRRLLAEDYQRVRRQDDAIRLYEEILAAEPKHPAATNDLAALLLDHRTDQASHQRALDLARTFADSRNPLALDTLGWAYYRTGDADQAARVLERAVAINSNVPVLHYHLGMAYLAAGNTARAKEALGAATADSKADYAGLDAARQALAGLK